MMSRTHNEMNQFAATTRQIEEENQMEVSRRTENEFRPVKKPADVKRIGYNHPSDPRNVQRP